MALKNVVFDVGNVLVRWEPHKVIAAVFPEHDPHTLLKQMRPTWITLNQGKISALEAIKIHEKELNLPEHQLMEMMERFKTSQTPIEGSIQLLEKLQAAGCPLYALTDNIKEFIAYYRESMGFLHYFKGVVVSAEVGILKPNQEIYHHLLNSYQLEASESVFIDDLQANVDGAIAVGMQAFQFINAVDCQEKLRTLGVI